MTTHGMWRCGLVAFCISITSSSDVPNIDGLNGAFCVWGHMIDWNQHPLESGPFKHGHVV